jgi:hypothetical protein
MMSCLLLCGTISVDVYICSSLWTPPRVNQALLSSRRLCCVIVTIFSVGSPKSSTTPLIPPRWRHPCPLQLYKSTPYLTVSNSLMQITCRASYSQLCHMVLGVYITLFLTAIHLQLRREHPQKVLLVYSFVMFCITTAWYILSMKTSEISFMDAIYDPSHGLSLQCSKENIAVSALSNILYMGSNILLVSRTHLFARDLSCSN